MGLWALGFLIYFTLLLGRDADYVLPACYHRRAYYHAYTNHNWLIGLVIPAFKQSGLLERVSKS